MSINLIKRHQSSDNDDLTDPDITDPEITRQRLGEAVIAIDGLCREPDQWRVLGVIMCGELLRAHTTSNPGRPRDNQRTYSWLSDFRAQKTI